MSPLPEVLACFISVTWKNIIKIDGETNAILTARSCHFIKMCTDNPAKPKNVFILGKNKEMERHESARDLILGFHSMICQTELSSQLT